MCNVLYDRNNQLFKLADLGAAAVLDSPHGTANERIGTNGFCAPEIMLGQAYGVAVDVYSLGALMFAIHTGSLPFLEKDEKAYARRLISEPFSTDGIELSNNLSDKAKNLLHGMLEKDPAKRLTIYEILEHPWLN